MSEVKPPDVASTPEAVVARIQEERNKLQRQLERYTTFRWPVLLVFCIFGATFTWVVWGKNLATQEFWTIAIPVGALGGAFFYWLVTSYLHTIFSFAIGAQDKLLTGVGIVKLQETLEEDFFTKLVKINFPAVPELFESHLRR